MLRLTLTVGLIVGLVGNFSLAQEQANVYEVRVNADLAYTDQKSADPERNKLDIYAPEGVSNAPVLFFIHGGGWTGGDRKKFEKLARTFAERGVVVVTPGYRLTPAVKHPGHIEDIARAFAWTHKNISQYGGRADAIFVSGHSAGGHLAALLATDESYLRAQSLSLANIKGAIPISGVFNVEDPKKANIFGDADSARKASPITQVKTSPIPFLILYADGEAKTLGAQAEEFAKAMTKAQNRVSVQMIKDRTHSSIVGNVPNPGDPTTQAVLQFIADTAQAKLVGVVPSKQ